MKKIVVHAGFHPEVERKYNGEHIHKVIGQRGGVVGKEFHTGAVLNSETTYYRLDNNAWIKALGNEKYETDWCAEERWGRVEEQEINDNGDVVDSKDLGFIILRVDRSKGML